MAKQGTKAWLEECQEVLVGIQASTSSVVRILVQRDGRMSGPDRVHSPAGGESAEAEAATVFGLSEVRRFGISDALAANDYAAALRHALASRPRVQDTA